MGGEYPVRDKYNYKYLITEVILLLLTAVIMIPIYYLIVTTLKTPADATAYPLGFPKSLYLDGYIKAWKEMNYPLVFMNTFIISAFSLIGMIIITAMAAYTIARKSTKVNRVIFIILLAGMMIPFQMGIVSLYKLVSFIGLMNKLPSVILINISINLPFGILLFRNFIASSVPVQLEESAYIDGCSVLRVFAQITMPLLKPVIATIAVTNCMVFWNDFLTPLLFLQSKRSQVILLAVNSNIGKFSTDWTSLFPMMLLGVMPLVIFFLAMQRFIIKGISLGAVKG